MSGSNQIRAEFWHKVDDGRVQCDLCPRHCRLQEGQRGLCFIRACENNQMVLTSYGLSSGYCIDPIEKKPLYHFYPGSPVLSFGTAGCNLTCKFCQNWDISKSKEMQTLSSQASPDKIARAAKQLGVKSVAFTYNDPIIFYEYARDTAEACHKQGVKTVAVTAGYISDLARESFFKHIDAANVDLKAFTEDFYQKVCGVHLEPVLETLKWLKHQSKVWFEMTTLLIPGMNDSDQELDQMTQWIARELGSDIPLHFSAFHPDYKLKDKSSTPHSTLIRARELAQKNGLNYVYLGNVHDQEAETTYCSECKTSLISRDWYEIKEFHLEHGRCPKCHAALAGHYDSRPGEWGAKRQWVDMESSAIV